MKPTMNTSAGSASSCDCSRRSSCDSLILVARLKSSRDIPFFSRARRKNPPKSFSKAPSLRKSALPRQAALGSELHALLKQLTRLGAILPPQRDHAREVIGLLNRTALVTRALPQLVGGAVVVLLLVVALAQPIAADAE